MSADRKTAAGVFGLHFDIGTRGAQGGAVTVLGIGKVACRARPSGASAQSSKPVQP